MSAAGDALQMLPASVARFRICTDPTTSAASASAANRVRIVASSAMSVITVPAPITSRSPSCRIPGASSGTRFTSTTTPAEIVRSRRRMIRSVPPASGRAAAPCATSSPMASLRAPGRS